MALDAARQVPERVRAVGLDPRRLQLVALVDDTSLLDGGTLLDEALLGAAQLGLGRYKLRGRGANTRPSGRSKDSGE